MDITCPQCAARFNLPTSHIKPGGTRVRCSRCKHVFRVEDDAPPPPQLQKPHFGLASQAAASPPQSMPPGGEKRPIFGENTRHSFDMDDPFAHTSLPRQPAAAPAPRGPSALAELDEELDDDPQLDDVLGDLFDREDPFAATAFGQPKAPPQPQARAAAPIPAPAPAPAPLPDDPNAISVGPFGAADLMGELITRGTPETPSDAISTLGDAARAAQFAMNDESQIPGLSGNSDFFDPDRDPGAPAAPPRSVTAQPARTTAAAAFDGPLELADDPHPRGKAATPKKTPAAPTPAVTPATAPAPAPATPRPSGPAPAVIRAAPAVAELAVRAQTSLAQSVANVALILLLVAMVFLGFVAGRNGGVLDFNRFGDQMAAAFGAGAPAPAPPAANAAADTSPLSVDGVEPMTFPNREGRNLHVVEGRVTNQGATSLVQIRVVATATGPDGAVLASCEAPAGRTLTEAELAAITSPDELTRLYATLRAETADKPLEPKDYAPFTAVFPDLKLPDGVTPTFAVKVEHWAPQP
jgi:predicted Zn finger-like uncharacterized protein